MDIGAVRIKIFSMVLVAVGVEESDTNSTLADHLKSDI